MKVGNFKEFLFYFLLFSVISLSVSSEDKIETIPLINLEELWLSDNLLSFIPESICDIPDECNILLHNNQLCEEYHYDCIGYYGEQDQTNCCEGENGEPNWTQCP